MLTGTRDTSNSSPLKKGSMTMFNRPANRWGQDARLEKLRGSAHNSSPSLGVKHLDVRLLVPSRKNSTGANPF